MDERNQALCNWQGCETCDTRCAISQRLPTDNGPLNPNERSSDDAVLYRYFYLQEASQLQPGPSWSKERGINAVEKHSMCVGIGSDNQLVLQRSKTNCDKWTSATKQFKGAAMYHAYSGSSFAFTLSTELGCGVKIENGKLMATSSRSDCPGSGWGNYLTPVFTNEYGISSDNKMGGPFTLKSGSECVGTDNANRLILKSCTSALNMYWRTSVRR